MLTWHFGKSKNKFENNSFCGELIFSLPKIFFFTFELNFYIQIRETKLSEWFEHHYAVFLVDARSKYHIKHT